MIKEFSISNDKVTINFTAKYCSDYQTLLDSDGFKRVLEAFLSTAERRNSNAYKFVLEKLKCSDKTVLVKKLTNTFLLLTTMSVEEMADLNSEYSLLVDNKDAFIDFVEALYSFWRRLERYSIVHNNRIQQGIAAVSFTEANSNFSRLILSMYRKVEKNITGYMPNVYRQVPAGTNACMMLSDVIWPVPNGYEMLEQIPFIDTISLETPFITYPKKNTRDGMFKEVKENPLDNAQINKDHWFCYPAKIGELLGFIYFHRDFMEHGITLCNLFELAKVEEYRGRKPDLIYIFGGTDESEKLKTIFYEDKQNDIMVGYVNHSQEIDYFGYMKKMCLTLHNLIMIKRGYLPTHGSMVNIVLKDGKQANVVIMGDSGAGKSESLEAFRALSEEYISDMTIIFDDMGVMKEKDGQIYGYGTEVGAFVRLDDLDQGYAFKEIDRSIFMNPDKINARLVMPVATYKEIRQGYKIDLLLYANNYTDVKDGDNSISFFNNAEEAKNVFKAGARMAKGTTTEKGLVTSYFANPFGPAQKQKETDKIIDKYFDTYFKNNIGVGEIKTCLAIKGKEKQGPKKAAIELFDIIKKLK